MLKNNHMFYTNNNGSFGLGEIKKITKRNMELNTIYVISFVNDKRKMYASTFHCFLTDENIPKSTSQLIVGDRIWIDISAFTADKSLI